MWLEILYLKGLCQIYTKIPIYSILYRNSRFKQIKFSKYTTNLKKDIPEKPNCSLGFPQLLFLFLIDIINNIIYKSVLKVCFKDSISFTKNTKVYKNKWEIWLTSIRLFYSQSCMQHFLFQQRNMIFWYILLIFTIYLQYYMVIDYKRNKEHCQYKTLSIFGIKITYLCKVTKFYDAFIISTMYSENQKNLELKDDF